MNNLRITQKDEAGIRGHIFQAYSTIRNKLKSLSTYVLKYTASQILSLLFSLAFLKNDASHEKIARETFSAKLNVNSKTIYNNQSFQWRNTFSLQCLFVPLLTSAPGGDQQHERFVEQYTPYKTTMWRISSQYTHSSR